MSEMSFEDAVQALQQAAAVDPMVGGEPAPEQAPAAPAATPEGANPTPEVQPVPEAPEAPSAPEPAPAADTFDGGQFNPDTLPPELVPAWRQLQGAYTRKTQELAEQRKQFEAIGDPDVVADAVELYTRLQDPTNWLQLHTELSQAMKDAGLTPAQADRLATEELHRQQAAPSPIAGLDLDDPDLAPLAQALKAQADQQARLQQQIEALVAEQQFRAQAEEAERQQALHAARMQQQIAAIRQARPDYTDDDLRDIVSLGSFYNDDLSQAQAAYEAAIARRLERYFAAKQAAQTPSIQPQPGAGVQSVQDDPPASLADAQREAIEYLRGLQAAGELDF